MSSSRDHDQTSGSSRGGEGSGPLVTPTTVNPARDGHPGGRHMIDAFRMMAVAARTSGGKHQRDMADVYDMAALCIENEARRADRAEAAIAKATVPSSAKPALGEGSRDEPNPPIAAATGEAP